MTTADTEKVQQRQLSLEETIERARDIVQRAKNCILVDLREFGTPTLRFYFTAYSVPQPFTLYPLRQHSFTPIVLHTKDAVPDEIS